MNLKFLDDIKIYIRDWFAPRAHGAYSKAWLFAIALSESIFLFIPVDLLLMAILMVNANRWIYFALLASVGSVLGAALGYGLGAFLFNVIGVKIIGIYGLWGQMDVVRTLFEQNAFWAMFISAFTPIPFKVFVLSAGFFKISFLAFLFASILGRTLRFLFVAYATKVFGERASYIIFKYFNIITVTILLALLVFVLKYALV